MAKVEYTNEDGIFTFRQIPVGAYWLQLSFVGFETYNSEIFTLKSKSPYDFKKLKLSSAATGLDEVVVTAEKTIVRIKK